MTPAGSRLAVLLSVFSLVSLAWSQSCSDSSVSYQFSYESIDEDAETEHCTRPPDGECCQCSSEIYICDGLDAALEDLELKIVNDSAEVTLSLISNSELVLDLNNTYSFRNLDRMEIRAIGDGDVTINCSVGAGIVFNGVRQVSVTGMKWYGCGTSSNTMTISTNNYIGGLIFMLCSDVSITNVTFEKSRGSGILIDLRSLLGEENTNYTYRIVSSHFRNNTMQPEYGGGVYMYVGTVQHQPTFLFEDCTFSGNIADYGGGIYIEGPRMMDDTCSTEPHVTFKNCSFYRNTATMTGGAVYVRSYTTLFTDQCTFLNNTAQLSAAAVSIDLSDLLLSCPTNVTTINSCHFEGNSAQESSAVFIVNSRRQKNHSVILRDTQFLLNSVKRLLYGSEATSCAVHIERVLTYVIDTDFSNSTGAGICMDNANITVGGEVEFRYNHGYFGGGMFLAGDSVIFFSQRSNLTFLENKAIYGGGLTGWSPADFTCVFSFSDDASMSTVWFVNNTAAIAGNAIYINSPSNYCRRIDFENRNFNFVPNTTRDIASGVQQVQVLQDMLNIIPGQSIPVEAEVLDFYRNPSSAVISAFITDSDSDYSLNGLSEFSIENGTTLSSFYVTGPNQQSQATLNLVATTDTIFNFRKINNITLNISNCSLGFSYDDDNKVCQCINASSDVLECDIGSGQACIKKQYWVGVVNNATVYTQCTLSSCEKINTTCHFCSISKDDDEYCDVTGLSSFECPDNRAGIICAACAQNYSFSYGAVKCVSNENCDINTGKLVIVPFLVIIFLVIIICLLILFLKLDYQISTGYMFAFIYYFSIVEYFLPANIHSSQPLLILVSVFESITQLNPQFLAYVPLCVPNLSALWHQALLYLNPLVSSIIVIIFILIAKVCSRYIRFSDSTPVRAICLLLLLSFTAFNESSISILAYVKFSGLDDYFVAIQPSTMYFQYEHLGLFIVAVAIEMFLIIPFTLFLFLSPFLVRCINFPNKLKPFLDEFQGCYKDNFRWMAAFYFFWRQVYLFLIILVNINESLTAYILQFTSMFVLVFHMLLRPYREDWLNLVDTIFLADLLCISLLYGQTAEVVFAGPAGTIVRMVLTYILVLIPIFYFIGVVVVALFRKFPIATEKILYVILCKRFWEEKFDDDTDFASSYTHIRTPSQESVRNFREPLLSDEFEDSERSNRRRSRRSTRNLPFTYRRDRSRPTASYSVVEPPAAIVESSEGGMVKSGRTGSQTWQEEGRAVGTHETVDNEEL